MLLLPIYLKIYKVSETNYYPEMDLLFIDKYSYTCMSHYFSI